MRAACECGDTGACEWFGGVLGFKSIWAKHIKHTQTFLADADTSTAHDSAPYLKLLLLNVW